MVVICNEYLELLFPLLSTNYMTTVEKCIVEDESLDDNEHSEFDATVVIITKTHHILPLGSAHLDIQITLPYLPVCPL